MVTSTLAAIISFSSIGSKGVARSVGLFPVVWIGVWFGTSIAQRLWESKTRPTMPHFARAVAAGHGHMLREDQNAGFFTDRGGFLWTKRVWFVGTGCPPVRITPNRLVEIRAESQSIPVLITTAGDRKWWTFEGRCYWDNEGYAPEDVQALAVARNKSKERRLQHAHTVMAARSAARSRERIPEDVQRLIYRRDGGCCQRCGSSELLQFDHIIPFRMGGSSEAANLQLLCAPCNRAKSASL